VVGHAVAAKSVCLSEHRERYNPRAKVEVSFHHLELEHWYNIEHILNLRDFPRLGIHHHKPIILIVLHNTFQPARGLKSAGQESQRE
jgi:hypothetical protein